MGKQEQLEDYLKTLKKVAIAYSGGIDSSYLLFIANKVLSKKQVLAVIANGSMVPRKDYEEAITFLKEQHFQYIEVPYKPLEIKAFKENHKDRCYYCKKELMTTLKKEANKHGYETLLDGKNADDLTVYRPGNRATEEVGIISPLAKLEISKKEIRQYSKDLGIPFWNKPSNSCLATRFPYNTTLTEEGLKKVEKSEEIIKGLGIKKVRVRVHDTIARIEVNPEDFEKILNMIKHKKEDNIIERIKNLGFSYVTLDLSGLKTGSFD